MATARLDKAEEAEEESEIRLAPVVVRVDAAVLEEWAGEAEARALGWLVSRAQSVSPRARLRVALAARRAAAAMGSRDKAAARQ